MPTKSIFLFFLLFSASTIQAQRKVYEHLNFNFGGKKDLFLSSIPYTQSLNLFKKESIWLGTGFHLFNFNSKNQIYNNTAKINNSLEFIEPSKVNISSLNIPLFLELSTPKRRIFGGVSLDLIGLSTGKSQKIPVSGLADLPSDSISIRPHYVNIVGISKSHGTHTSSIYIGFQPSAELAFRVGLTQVSSEIKEIGKDNFYKMKSLLPFFSICFNFER